MTLSDVSFAITDLALRLARDDALDAQLVRIQREVDAGHGEVRHLTKSSLTSCRWCAGRQPNSPLNVMAAPSRASRIRQIALDAERPECSVIAVVALRYGCIDRQVEVLQLDRELRVQWLELQVALAEQPPFLLIVTSASICTFASASVLQPLMSAARA